MMPDLKSCTVQDTLIFSFTFFEDYPFILNTWESIRSAGLKNWKFVIFCFDQESIDALEPYGLICVPFFNVQCDYLTSVFKEVFTLESLSSNIKYLLFIQSDVVVVPSPKKNLLSFLQEYLSDDDVLFQCDEYEIVECLGKETCGSLGKGIVFCRNEPSLIDFLENAEHGKIKYNILPQKLFPNGRWLSKEDEVSMRYIQRYNHMDFRQKKTQ